MYLCILQIYLINEDQLEMILFEGDNLQQKKNQK